MPRFDTRTGLALLAFVAVAACAAFAALCITLAPHLGLRLCWTSYGVGFCW